MQSFFTNANLMPNLAVKMKMFADEIYRTCNNWIPYMAFQCMYVYIFKKNFIILVFLGVLHLYYPTQCVLPILFN